MAHRSIEETFRSIRPRGVMVPGETTISAGVTGANGNLGTALSQAGQQIAQLQTVYKQQAALIQANTQALQGNTSSKSGGTLGSVASGIGSSFLGGGLGLLSPLISGIASLFGGGSSAPAPLPVYIPPPSVAISANLRGGAAQGGIAPETTTGAGSGSGSGASAQPAAAPQITVNVQAMDSQSFMDRSTDIANAVREAMLNLHPINAVVAEL